MALASSNVTCLYGVSARVVAVEVNGRRNDGSTTGLRKPICRKTEIIFKSKELTKIMKNETEK